MGHRQSKAGGKGFRPSAPPFRYRGAVLGCFDWWIFCPLFQSKEGGIHDQPGAFVFLQLAPRQFVKRLRLDLRSSAIPLRSIRPSRPCNGIADLTSAAEPRQTQTALRLVAS